MSPAQEWAPQVLRGLQLKEIGRYADAEAAFLEAVAREPHDPFILHHLATCQFHLPERLRDALSSIEGALAIEPNEAAHHILRSFILCTLSRPKEALAAAENARTLQPESHAAFSALAQAYLQLERWSDAEAAARQALRFDAENSTASNQLAQALRMQNKMEESGGHLASMLSRDPENPYTHANAGWAALQQGEHLRAESHFREALRLDPDFSSAREGLLNSFRARSPIYRLYLRYTFAMQRLRAGSRWAVIVGLYVAARIGARVHGLWGLAALALYFFFVLWVWVARPVGNLMLLADRSARFALHKEERYEAVFVGGGLLVGILLGAAGVGLNSDRCLIAGVGLVAQSFPLAMIFTNASRPGRWLFGTVAAFTFAAMLVLLVVSFVAPASLAWALKILVAGCVGCLASTWLGNIPALRTAR